MSLKYEPASEPLTISLPVSGQWHALYDAKPLNIETCTLLLLFFFMSVSFEYEPSSEQLNEDLGQLGQNEHASG